MHFYIANKFSSYNIDSVSSFKHLDISFVWKYLKAVQEFIWIKYIFSLQSKNYSARYKFTGKGTFKITNINSEDAGQWLCYDEKNDYTSKNEHLNEMFLNWYRRGLENPQATTFKSGRSATTLFSSLFSDASERRVWLSAESKILACTFEHFRLYR